MTSHLSTESPPVPPSPAVAGAPVGTPTPAAAAVLRAAAATLEDAAADPRRTARLAVVGTTVALDVRDAGEEPLVVRFGPDAIDVDTGGPADIGVELDARDLHELFAGGLHLPMKIAAGRVAYRGQVRRFLRVVPVLAGMGDVYAAHLRDAGEAA